jgi:hypothetical protein
MAGSKPDERETGPAPTDGAGARTSGSGAMKKAVPPPLPPPGTRSSRGMRAVNGTEGDPGPRLEEAPTLYSQVGRRSSAGTPAVSIAVENVGAVTAAPSPARSGPSTPPEAAAPAPAPAHPALSAPVRPAHTLERARSRTGARQAFDGEVDPPTEKLSRAPVSVRPSAPEPFAAAGAEGESIAQTFDRLLGSEVDSRFGEIKQASERPPVDGVLADAPGSLAEIRDLFEQLAANHVRPVREFVIDLRWGEASGEWIAVCCSSVESLRRAAQKLGLVELEAGLQAFARVLQSPGGEAGASSAVIDGAARDQILAAYDQLTAVLPKAFALDMDRAQRESLIVQSLLLQIPEVHRVTIERLHAAGLNGISMLAEARSHEVAEAAGISVKLAERIVEAFRAYREDRHAHLPDAMHASERGRVDLLLNELEAHHAAFERAAQAWTPAATAEKARLRRARHKTLMEISVILARIGEIALLQKLEKVPFDRKLDGLRVFLTETRGS